MSHVNGYVFEYVPTHHRAGDNGMVPEHVLIAEEKIGRDLKAEEVVHHINHIRNDNRPENLMIFATKADHSAFHRGNDIYFDSDLIAHATRINHTCTICGKNIPRNNLYCIECYKKYIQPYKMVKANITRDTLKEKIRNETFVDIAKEYGVTDNGIRKWCKKFGLPTKSSEIKRYTDDEWKNI